jgi:hypothetical protein
MTKPINAPRFPRFGKGDAVDVRLPGVALGDWEFGTVVDRCGPVYTVKTPSGELLKADETDLFLADK